LILLIGEREAIAFSMIQQLAVAQPTCDSKLALAHAQSLHWWTPLEPGTSEKLWADAMTACPEDPTAQYAAGIDKLLKSLASGCGGSDVLPPDGRDDILGEFAELQRDHPALAAGFVGEGELRLGQAREAQSRGLRPFWVRSQLASALAAFKAAAARSSDPEIARGVARVHIAQGDLPAAYEALTPVLNQDPPWPTVALAAELLAASGKTERALATAADLSESEYFAEPDTLVLSGGSLPYPVTQMVGHAKSRESGFFDFSGGCGGSLVGDTSFLPTSRPLPPSDGDMAFDEVMALADPTAGLEIAADEDADQHQSRMDGRQHLLRTWGKYPEAVTVIEEWVRYYPTDWLAFDRLGEAKYLAGDYTAAVNAFDRSLALNDSSFRDPWYFSGAAIGVGWTTLRLGAALLHTDRKSEAKALFEAALTMQVVDQNGVEDPSVRFHALGQLAEIDYKNDDYKACLAKLEEAIAIGESYEAENKGSYLLRGAEEQRASAAALQLEEAEAARRWAERARTRDPDSPLFIETLAEGTKATGDAAQAITDYEAALSVDRSLFSTWNNLGVLLWKDGQEAAAEEAFQNAVLARPEYATAWFNLGTIWSSEPQLLSAIAAQGALGKAARLDGSLRNAEPTVLFDDVVYDAGVDIARDIPAQWRLTETVQPDRSRLTISLVAMLIFRMAWTLGADKIIERAIETVLKGGSAGLPPQWLRWITSARPHWSIMAAISGGVALWVAGLNGWLAWLLAALAVAGALGLHLLTTGSVSASTTGRSSWPLASVVTGSLAPFGFGFAPPPVLRDESNARVLRVRIGALVLGGLATMYLALAWATSLPLASLLASAALLITSSALVPVRPLDGAWLSLKKVPEVLITVALAGATLVTGMGWV
jgi:tetratricopeptide (TPR) repeat protein